MSRYVSRVVGMRNGSRIVDIKNFKKDAVEYRKSVTTMGGTDTVEVAGDHVFSFDHVLTKVNPKIDWSEVENENWAFELNGGSRIEYTGVDCLTEGDITVDNEKETIQTITMHAKTRTIR